MHGPFCSSSCTPASCCTSDAVADAERISPPGPGTMTPAPSTPSTRTAARASCVRMSSTAKSPATVELSSSSIAAIAD